MHIFTNDDHINLAAIRRRHRTEFERCYEISFDSPPERAAALAAQSKLFKRDVTLLMIDRIAIRNELDMTTAVAKAICRHLLGRSVSIAVLAERYGTAGRSSANRSAVFERGFDLGALVEREAPGFKEWLETEARDIRHAAGASASGIRNPIS
ncbi:hypothetical protein [Roseibium aggregatum]|uniref:Uncharacterized protein n=1 Tax=Roseibium aggregatum TaxID=187304 RepID=A0A0M6YC83_9HYPH|nr:hypothetical protein [Roseibium aggregatum]CTQ47706.1 hypothetical protein LAL4801_06168 [Roseibium aggregatum]